MSTQTIADLIATIQALGSQQGPSSYDSFRILLDRLGNPHHKLPLTIHVAGTNGKGSTLADLDSIMRRAGFKVHRYTSPHLVSVCERIQTSNEMISGEALEHHLRTVASHATGLNLTFFDMMTAAAFLEFAASSADYLLLETGIGGEFDPTNVIEKPVATIFTQIGLDHLQRLGPRLVDIAQTKAGIIKQDCPVFTYVQDPIIMAAIVAQAEAKHAPLYTVPVDQVFETGLLGPHQNINASLAAGVARYLGIAEEHIKTGIANAQWPARMQQVAYHGREVWLDMAHNPSAAEVASKSMKELGAAPFHLIFSLRETKDLKGFLEAFRGHILSIRYVPFKADYADGHTIEKLSEVSEELDLRVVISDGLAIAMDQTPAGPVLITGSAVLVGEALEEAS